MQQIRQFKKERNSKMASEFFVSSNVVFGKDAAKEIPKMLSEYNAKSVMVVYDTGVKMAGISTKVLEEVEKADVKITIDIY